VPAKCDVCGKTPHMGNSITRRGKAKYLGGVGRKITGITRRKFRPNLQNIKVTFPNGSPGRMCVCAQCLRSGKIQKRVKRVVPKPAE
jgi:large subunit ribosomal protein L28